MLLLLAFVPFAVEDQEYLNWQTSLDNWMPTCLLLLSQFAFLQLHWTNRNNKCQETQMINRYTKLLGIW